MVDALLAAYDTAIQTSTTAAAAMDRLAIAVNSPSRILAELRAANEHGMLYLPQADSTPAETAGSQPHPGQIEHTPRDLSITEPAMLGRATAIDDAAHDLITEATARSGRQDAAARNNAYRKKGAGGRAARLADKDTPRAPAQLNGWRAGNLPATPAAHTSFRRSAPQDETPTAARASGRRT